MITVGGDSSAHVLIIAWAQDLRGEKLIDGDRLLVDSELLRADFNSGIPPVYGFETLDGIL